MNKRYSIILNNMLYAFSAQGISLLLSVMMSLLVPKMLGVEEFAYWQLFLFYSSYVGFFLFGISDGLYLKLGGEKYEEIDYSLIGTQFRISSLIQSMIALSIIILCLIFIHDTNRQFVLICTAIYLIIFNITGFMGYIFQAVNKTNIYSLAVMIDRSFFIVSVILLVFLEIKVYKIFVIAYIVSKVFAMIYTLYIGRKILFSKSYGMIKSLKQMGVNIRTGINLTLSNIAGLLIFGSGRFIIDNVWGITTFGKFSFALTLANFFMQFISQISMVLFPVLRQIDEKQQKYFYTISRDVLGIVLMGIMLVYLPMQNILLKWLPQYQESLRYLALLLPLCVFDGKMNMLCNTYLMVLRKEKMLLRFNLIALAVSFILSILSVFLIRNIYVVIISMVTAIACRSIIAEIYLSKLIGASIYKSIVLECIMAAIFISSTWFIGGIAGSIIYACAYIVYVYIYRIKIKEIFTISKKMIQR